MKKYFCNFANLNETEDKFGKIHLFLMIGLLVLLLLITAPSLLEFEFGDSTTLRIENSVTRNIKEIISHNFDTSRPPMMFIIYNIYFRFIEKLDSTIISIPTYIFFILSSLSFFFVTYKLFGLIPAIIATYTFIWTSFTTGNSYIFGIQDMFIFIFFAIWSLYFFYKSFVLNDEKSKLFFVIFNALMFWTYYASVFIFLGQVAFLFVHKNNKLFCKNNLKYHIIFFFLCLPISFRFINSITTRTISKSVEVGFRVSTNEFFYSVLLGTHPILNNISNIIFIVLILGIILISIIFLFLKSDKYKIPIYYILFFLLIIPFLLKSLNYYYQYSTAFFWIISILISYPIIALFYRLKTKIGRKRISNIIITITILFFSIQLINHPLELRFGNSPYKEAIDDFKKLEIDIIVIDQIHLRHNYKYYLMEKISDYTIYTGICKYKYIFYDIASQNRWIAHRYYNEEIIKKIKTCTNLIFYDVMNIKNNSIIIINLTPENLQKIISEAHISNTLNKLKINHSNKFMINLEKKELKEIMQEFENCNHHKEYERISSYICSMQQNYKASGGS